MTHAYDICTRLVLTDSPRHQVQCDLLRSAQTVSKGAQWDALLGRYSLWVRYAAVAPMMPKVTSLQEMVNVETP